MVSFSQQNQVGSEETYECLLTMAALIFIQREDSLAAIYLKNDRIASYYYGARLSLLALSHLLTTSAPLQTRPLFRIRYGRNNLLYNFPWAALGVRCSRAAQRLCFFLNVCDGYQSMEQGENQRDGITPPEITQDLANHTDEALPPVYGYGYGPFTRPLPKPSGCWAGCIRNPCCLTNRPDRRPKTS